MHFLNLTEIKHAVVVAPHADDETIAAFYTICALRRQGTRVDVVVATDGSASHRNSRTWPKTRLVSERRRETINAMALADVPRNRIEFLGLPDGGLDTLTTEQRQQAVARLGKRRSPDLIIVPSEKDDHPDHRNVAAMCDSAWKPSIWRLQYVVWPREADKHPCGNSGFQIYGNPLTKRVAIKRYRSQLGAIRDDPTGFTLNDTMLARMCTRQECFS